MNTIIWGLLLCTILARRFAKLFSLQEIGGVIILEMNVNDYSLAHISQIVESNDTKILSTFLNRKPGHTNHGSHTETGQGRFIACNTDFYALRL
jgi:hypothetical protein